MENKRYEELKSKGIIDSNDNVNFKGELVPYYYLKEDFSDFNEPKGPMPYQSDKWLFYFYKKHGMIKTDTQPKSDDVFDVIVEFVSQNNNEYKKELIDFVKCKLPNLPKGKISSTLRRLKKLGIIEQSVHETSRQKIISKGRYWDSHIGKGGN